MLSQVNINISPRELLHALAAGPRKARSLSVNEARAMVHLWAKGEMDDVQFGSLLLIMRHRGETAEEVAGVALALRDFSVFATVPELNATLDWPCYAGKREQFPWLLFAALRLGKKGQRIVLHGDELASPKRNHVGAFVKQVGIPVAIDAMGAAKALDAKGVVYMSLDSMLPLWPRIRALHRTLSLRTLLTQAVRFFNPANCHYGVRTYFHHGLDVHYQAVLAAMAPHCPEQELVIFRGHQGEAEINPRVENELLFWRCGAVNTMVLPICAPEGTQAQLQQFGGDDEVLTRFAHCARPGAEDMSLQAATVNSTLAVMLLLLKQEEDVSRALNRCRSGKALANPAIDTLCQLLVKQGCRNESEAFQLLRAQSMRTGMGMEQLARQLLAQVAAA
ncbi:ANTAR domain-containing protein [Shewanella acanthi]|uniref:ANTAR domain-containing protein n=1 Tax=Shewanella acanthi TaxID=2864212 RepID=UPI001C66252A|nr:ANTAR domain-containing protein [Shewanella acanthi]QYJ78732.1 ANTAR domain-containing protein [Shewanella acanthi]